MKRRFYTKIKSRKAYTLVELIVTITILSITAGFGIGIFASAMSNYSSASITATEQDKALQIESFILTHARVANQVFYITNDPSKVSKAENVNHVAGSDSIIKSMFPEGVGGIITHDPAVDRINEDQNKINYYDIYDTVVNKGTSNESRTYSDGAKLNLSGVKDIKFRLKRQRVDLAGLKDSFPYLYYEINMANGYSIKGNVILNNCKNVQFIKNGNYTDKTDDTTFTVCDDTYATGIAFIKV